MRQVNKHKHPPEVKFTQLSHPNFGEVKYIVFTQKLCEAFDRNNKDFIDGNVKFNDEFGYNEYREHLIDTIGNKCCYCEKPVHKGEIEHYRPKAAYKNSRTGTICRPGYYWLAYSWNNMLLSCGECNDQGRKGNNFPLVVESNRCLNRNGDLTKEQPIYIHPVEEDPCTFITFNLNIPIGLDIRGEKTIEDLGLDSRGDLVTSRHEKLKLFRQQYRIAQLDPENGIFSKEEIEEAKLDVIHYQHIKQPFSGMIIENIKNNLI